MRAPVGIPDVGDGRLVSARQRLSWAFFDWAQQPYVTLVAAFLFKPYFSSGFLQDPVRGQTLIGYAGGLSAFCVAVLTPFLGVAIDRGGRPKRWIALASMLFVAACFGLWFADPAHPERALLILGCLVLAAVTAEITTSANNTMLPYIAAPGRLGRLSGSAMALGYLGGLVALVIYLVAFTFGDPPLLGLDKSAREPERFVGPFVAIWYLVFVAPMFLWTPTRPPNPAAARETAASLLRLLRSRPEAARFLLGRMLVADGLSAAGVFGGLLAAGLFDWGMAELGTYGVAMVTLSGLGAWVAGRLDDRFNPKVTAVLAICILALGVAGVGSVTRDTLLFAIPLPPPTPGDGFLASPGERIFMALGLMIGLAAGPLQTSLRAWMAQLAPAEEEGRWFGLFALSNKATAFATPLLVGALTAVVQDQRIAIPVILAFLLAGVLVLRGAPERTSPASV